MFKYLINVHVFLDVYLYTSVYCFVCVCVQKQLTPCVMMKKPLLWCVIMALDWWKPDLLETMLLELCFPPSWVGRVIRSTNTTRCEAFISFPISCTRPIRHHLRRYLKGLKPTVTSLGCVPNHRLLYIITVFTLSLYCPKPTDICYSYYHIHFCESILCLGNIRGLRFPSL